MAAKWWVLFGLLLGACGSDSVGGSPGDAAGSSSSDDGGSSSDARSSGDGGASNDGGASGDAGAPSLAQPLAQDEPGIWFMTTDATHLYWVRQFGLGSGAVKRMPLQGGAIETLYTGSQLGEIAVAAGFVYIAQLGTSPQGYIGSLLRMPITGGPATTLVTTYGLAYAITADAESVYYRDGDVNDTRLMRVSLGGGNPQFIVRPRQNQGPADMCADAGFVYFVDNYRIMRVDVQRKRVSELVNEGVPVSITIDAQFVYFVSCVTSVCSNASVYRVPRDGGAIEPLASGVNHNAGLAVIENDLQWGSSVLPASGGAVRTLMVTQLPRAVAATHAAFYFAEYFTGVIYRAPR